tara:strand:- start:4539 stop:4925 length:387 start_codon:yes stop_codon:yes gene_type:complete
MEKTLGIRHIAIKVSRFDDCLDFYHKILKMQIDWKPDNENVYLTNGQDNLALHYDSSIEPGVSSRLDHFGIILEKKTDVDKWYKYISSEKVKIFKDINDHRDGSRSFYCEDPDGNVIQLIWHPKISLC